MKKSLGVSVFYCAYIIKPLCENRLKITAKLCEAYEKAL
jgi:hypothetical protein